MPSQTTQAKVQPRPFPGEQDGRALPGAAATNAAHFLIQSIFYRPGAFAGAAPFSALARFKAQKLREDAGEVVGCFKGLKAACVRFFWQALLFQQAGLQDSKAQGIDNDAALFSG